jgi:hypothetical protein
MRLSDAVKGTVTWCTPSASVLIVSVLPLMAVMVPPRGAGACARTTVPAVKKTISNAEAIVTRIFIISFIDQFSTGQHPAASGWETFSLFV